MSGGDTTGRFRTRAATGQVTATELFFDLVFVFVVTQATHDVETHPGWEGFGHAVLPLLLLWWMFLAFGWLTNAVRPDGVPHRLLLSVAMIAFFVTGLDLPFAFGSEGWAFPIAYLVAVGVHTALYLTASAPSARRGILRVAPINAAAGVLVLIAPHLPEPAEWALWVIAVLMVYASPFTGAVRGFTVEPHHFVERHGVILLLVLGESVVAIGIGAAGEPVDGALTVGVALGIALTTALWWLYFDGDEERSVAALEAAPAGRRQFFMAFDAFALGHVTMVVGAVLVAAGIADAVHHFDGHAHRWWLGAGAAVFLLGHAAHRLALGTGPVRERVVGAVAVVPVGTTAHEAGWLGLLGVTLVLAVVAVLDHRSAPDRPAEPAEPHM